MGKETKDTRQDKGGAGGDSLEDGLDKASEQAAHLSDKALAALFIEANEEARELDTPPFRELFVEEKKVHHIEEIVPDDEFLKEIYDSLERKEIHHKKLLEENIPSSRLLRIVYNIKSLVKLPALHRDEVIVPANWKLFSIFWRNWRKTTNSYFSNFTSLTDLYLRKPNYAQFMLKWEFLAMLFILVFCCPVIVLFAKEPWSVNDITKSFSIGWSTFIFSSAIIACILSVAPIFFFLSLWFVNVNRLHNSKYFHIFLFASFTVAFIFMALSVFNAGLFYIADYKWGITSTYQVLPEKS